MEGILTSAFQQRANHIASNFITPDIDIEELDIYKSASGPEKKKVKKVMDEWKSGKLKSSSGDSVTNQKQAVAIALSEAGLSKKKVKKGETKCMDDKLMKDDVDEVEESIDVEKSFEDLLNKGTIDSVEQALNIIAKGGAGSGRRKDTVFQKEGKAHEKMKKNWNAARNIHTRKQDEEDEIEKGGKGSGKHKLYMTNEKTGRKSIEEFKTKEHKRRFMRNNYQNNSFKEEHELNDSEKEEYNNSKKINKSEEGDLQKGQISDILSSGYNSIGQDGKPMRFVKTGKEIIAKLKELGTQINTSVTDAITKMAALQKQIGQAPDDESISYSFKTIKSPRYSWSYVRGLGKEVVAESPVVEQPAQTEQVLTPAQLCDKYNDLAYRLVNLKEDQEAIRIITQELNPKEKCYLSVSQLASLGF